MPLLACYLSAEAHRPLIVRLANELNIPIVTDMAGAAAFRYLLVFDQALQLLPVDRSQGGPLLVDFHSAAMEHRRQTSGIRQDIARAAGCKPGYRPTVLDVTAGLGGDAFVLASLGCQVTMVENHPVVYALLEDGLLRAAGLASAAGEIVRSKMQLLPRQDALTCLSSNIPSVDVVYLDPMFPERQKSAKVKKAMQYFHDIVGFHPEQEKALLDLALCKAEKRVVVKRPKLAPLLDGREPSHQLSGKSVRYDVYLTGGRD